VMSVIGGRADHYARIAKPWPTTLIGPEDPVSAADLDGLLSRGSGPPLVGRATSMMAERAWQQYLQKRTVSVRRPWAMCGRLRVVKDFERVAAWSWQPCVRPFCAALTWSLALMPSADRVPVKSSHSRCCGPSGFSRSPVRPVLHNVLSALSNHCVTRLGA
jgi:hypothetical protein